MTVAVRQRDAFTIPARPRDKFVGHVSHALVTECRGQDRGSELMKLCYSVSCQLARLRQEAKPLKWKRPGGGSEPLKERASFHMSSTRPKS